MNETLKLIASRYSCREFADTPLEEDALKAIAEAAVAAPSAMNRQAWRVIVVKDKALIDEMDAEAMGALAAMEDRSGYDRMMARGGKLFYNAPVMMMIPIEKGTEMDCGILSENICIAAASLGIQSLICGMARMCFSEAKGASFTERLGFPEGYEFGIAVLLGHEKASGTPHTPDLSKISYIG